MRYIQIFKLELFICQRPYSFGKVSAHCGCIIFELGPIGITWLSKDCGKDPDDLEES